MNVWRTYLTKMCLSIPSTSFRLYVILFSLGSWRPISNFSFIISFAFLLSLSLILSRAVVTIDEGLDLCMFLMTTLFGTTRTYNEITDFTFFTNHYMLSFLLPAVS
jgi:hypothetical protein